MADTLAADSAADQARALRRGAAGRRNTGGLQLRSISFGSARVLAYAVPVLIAALAVQTWFQPGTVIASGDFPPPVPPGSAYLSHWSQVATGVGAPSYDIVMLPFAEFLNGAQMMGLDPELSQRIWLTILVAGSSAAAVFFAFSLALSALAAGLAGLFATFNAYRIIVSFDSVPVAALILSCLLGGLVLRAGLRRDSRSSVVAFALVSSALGFVFVNPPHFILVGAWIAVSVLLAWARGGQASLRSALSFLLRASPLVVLANCWWFVPAALTILHPNFSEQFAAPGPFAWAWTHRRASLLNALTLNTTWGWNDPMYYPYAPRLERLPFAPLRYAFPFLALLGLLVTTRRDRRVGVVVVVIGVIVLVVVKGLHQPLVSINSAFYTYVPGSWLFRDPFKVLLLLTLMYAVLGGIGVAHLFAVRGRLRLPAVAVGIAVTIGAMLYSYPLFTGDVVPDDRPLLPPAHVRIPNAWPEVTRFLGSRPNEGKVLVLPSADFYGLPTTWGYYGVPFTRYAIRRPVLEPLPGGGFHLPGIAEQLIISIERDLLTSRGEQAITKLRALGVRYILLRRDLDMSFPDRRLASPNRLAKGLIDVPGIYLLRSFGLLDIYAVGDAAGSEVFAAAPVASGGESHLIPRVMPLLPQNASIVMPGELPPPGHPEEVWSPGGQIRVLRVGDEALWKVEVRTTSAGIAIKLSEPVRPILGPRRIEELPARILRLPNVSSPVIVSLESASFLVERGKGWVDLGYGRFPDKVDLGLWELRSMSPIDIRPVRPVRDCQRQDDRSPEEVRLSASTVEIEGIPTLRLSARDHAACVAFPIEPFDLAARYRLEFDYRGVSGLPPRVCLWEEFVERCAPFPELDSSPGWHHFDGTTTLHPKARGLELFLYAFGTGNSTTATEFRSLRVEVFAQTSAQSWRLDPSLRVDGINLPRGWLELSAPTPLPEPRPIDLRSVGPVRDCNQYDDRSPEEVRLSASTVEIEGIPTLRLSARDHAACVAFPIEPFDLAARYRLEFDYRGVSGLPPRVCLWEEFVERCAPFPELDSSPGWHHFDGTTTLHPKARGLELFLYAFGTGNSTTATEFRRVRVTVDEVLDLFLIQEPRQVTLPRLEYERLGPAEFGVSVNDARDPYLLVLTESYASGWRVELENEDLDIPHVVVDGYANGWILKRTGSYELRLTYAPEGVARMARWVSLISLCTLAAYAVFSRLRKRRRRGFAGSIPPKLEA